MLLNAAVGSAKNITPNREKAASNEAGSNGNTWASAWTNRTRSHPLAARCANASTAADRSTPTTVPSGATARARSSAVSPPPQPMSRTLSPGCGASAAKARRPSGASCSSNGSRTSAHAPTRISSWVSAGGGLNWTMRRSLPDGLGMSRSPCKGAARSQSGRWAGQRRPLFGHTRSFEAAGECGRFPGASRPSSPDVGS
jgi:hypothetical protein